VPARRYTDQQFIDALADPDVRTVADLCRRLGIVPRGGNYEVVRHRAGELGIDLRRALAGRVGPPPSVRARPRRSWTDAQLLEALADPRIAGYPELCEHLGLRPYHGNYRNVRERAAELGVPLPREWSIVGPRPGSRGTRPSKIDAARLREALAVATTRRDVLEALGLPVTPSGYARLRTAIERNELPTDHLRRNGNRRAPLDELLVSGRLVSGLGRRLVSEGVKEHRCERCRRTTWEGVSIPLELDHIDGDRANNVLENLRLLCPNCHALTPTYRGRNIGRHR
jgi:5-methylcytosine-specific restriction endonuclease McrA